MNDDFSSSILLEVGIVGTPVEATLFVGDVGVVG